MIRTKDMPHLKDTYFKKGKKQTLIELLWYSNFVLLLIFAISWILISKGTDFTVKLLYAAPMFSVVIGLFIGRWLDQFIEYLSYLSDVVITSDIPVVTKDSIRMGIPGGKFENKRIIQVDIANVKPNRLQDVLEMITNEDWRNEIIS